MGSISIPTPRHNQVKIAPGQKENRNESPLTTAKTSVVANTGADNLNNRNKLVTASEFKNQRKRPIIQPVVESTEPQRKRKADHSPRCLTGDVGQILEFHKTFPDLNAFYEVFAKVFKVINYRDHRKIILLKNIDNTGAVLQAIFNEVDVKMVQLQPGDKVRCVGKFAGNDRRLTIFKISLSPSAYDETPYVRRLNLIGSFALKNSPK